MTDENTGDLPKPILIEDLGMMFHTESSKQKKRFGIYKCGFCGTNFKANTYDINRGDIKCCGCYHKRRNSETHKVILQKLYYEDEETDRILPHKCH